MGLAVVMAAITLTAEAGGASAASPFFGVVPQGRFGSSDVARMKGVVGTLRIPVPWYQVEPSRGEYDFSRTDPVVEAAARAGIDVLPFVWGSPSWIAADPATPPLHSAAERAAWAEFLKTLVGRYGPGGALWAGAGPARPIHRWQVWNEPNFGVFWAPRPSAGEYAELLRIAAGAIRSADPRARILLAGIAPIAAAPPPWVYLRELLEIPGVGRYFDVVSLHPYAGSLASMAYQIEQARAAIAASGDPATPLQVTEFGVASSGPRGSPMVKSPQGQARFLRRAFHMLLRNRRRWHIAGADWFTWRDERNRDPTCDFCQGAGLFGLDGVRKPAWLSFRRVTKEAGRGGPKGEP